MIAYRKMTGLARVPSTNLTVFKLLQKGAGTFHVRYPHDGRHVEGDLTRQVLAEIEPGGRVRALYTMSSGKPSTPTVIGRFRVYNKTPGTNSEGMVDSNYFIRGYAIHGYAEVPTYAASHGCLRVPIPNALAIYGWVQYGHAGRRVQRERRRQPHGQRQRRAVARPAPLGSYSQPRWFAARTARVRGPALSSVSAYALTRITRAMKPSPKP